MTEDLVERADLASELVRSASRYEDTVERALMPSLDGADAAQLAAERDRAREELRTAMTVIHERTTHVNPRNVHAPDAQGFEDTLEEVARRLPAQLSAEDRLISTYVAALPDEDRRQLAEDVTRALRNASERPRPPRTAVGRAVSNAHVKLDHTLEDVSSPSHPGSETIEG